NGQNLLSDIVNRGYVFRDNQIYLKHILILSSGDSIRIEERPEFVRNEAGQPGLERWFKAANVPEGIQVSLKSRDTTVSLNANRTSLWTIYFNAHPEQVPPDPQGKYDHLGRYWMEKSDCFTCHEMNHNTVGPAFQEI